jgi:hypothetical protein
MGCSQWPDGLYMEEGTIEDVAIGLATVPLQYTMYDSNVWIFEPGVAFPARTYVGERATWNPELTISTTITNESDPLDVGTLDGALLDTDGDSIVDLVEATIVLTDGTRQVSMTRFVEGDFDRYKCPYGPGTCLIGFAEPLCTFDPLPGERTFHVLGEASFKMADGASAFSAARPTLSFTTGPSGGGCPGEPGIPGSGFGCNTTFTTTVTGDTEGMFTWDLASITFEPDPTTVWFGVESFGETPPCPVPVK